jgi:hypothetical protein
MDSYEMFRGKKPGIKALLKANGIASLIDSFLENKMMQDTA